MSFSLLGTEASAFFLDATVFIWKKELTWEGLGSCDTIDLQVAKN